MIEISGQTTEYSSLINELNIDGFERDILSLLSNNSLIYKYPSKEYLLFELNLRKNIVDSAKELSKSRFSFAVFRKSECNTDFWDRTQEGGFKVKDGIKSYDAIRDIYEHSSKYGTECATAIVIVFYKAVSNIYPDNLFEKIFPNIYLMDWQHVDRDMGVHYIRESEDFFPGDCRYFKNPDVDPEHPEWQGENVIVMGDNLYYGHDIGVNPGQRVIDILNSLRFPGATESAYLTKSVTRPGIRHLADLYINYSPEETDSTMVL